MEGLNWDVDEEDKYAAEQRQVGSAGDSFPLRMLTENSYRDVRR